MGEERLIILKLLEQGKITESEAEQLLDALGDMEYDQATQNTSNTFRPYKINLSKDNDGTYSKDGNTNDSKDSNTNNDFEDVLKSIGKRIQNLGEELEGKFDVFGQHFSEKMINFGAVFADKSVDFAEKIVDLVENAVDTDALADTFNNLDLFGSVNCYEEILEKKLDDIGQVSLIFEGYNGSISLNQWDQPIIRVTAYISAKESKYDSNKPMFELQEANNVLHFFSKEVDWTGINLKIQLPKQVYNSVEVQNKNGSISVEGLDCNRLLLQTKNGHIKLNNVNAKEEAKCMTTNNKITIENCQAKDLLAVTKNSKIYINACKFNKIEGLTSNSKITVKDVDFNILQSISLKTTNAKIEVFGHIPKGTGVHFNASTTHGHINIDLPVTYVDNIKSYSSHRINARTADFEICKNIVFVKAYTTNASIYFYN